MGRTVLIMAALLLAMAAGHGLTGPMTGTGNNCATATRPWTVTRACFGSNYATRTSTAGN